MPFRVAQRVAPGPGNQRESGELWGTSGPQQHSRGSQTRAGIIEAWASLGWDEDTDFDGQPYAPGATRAVAWISRAKEAGTSPISGDLRSLRTSVERAFSAQLRWAGLAGSNRQPAASIHHLGKRALSQPFRFPKFQCMLSSPCIRAFCLLSVEGLLC